MNEILGVTIFAIVQMVNTINGIRTVHITGAADESECQDSIKSFTEDDLGGIVLFERAECTSELEPDYIQAILDKPIPDVMYVSYQIDVLAGPFPVRVLFSGVAEEWKSREGCEALAARYHHIDANARCIYPP